MNQPIVSTILLATDFSDSAALAQGYAEYLAVALKASVVILHVSEHAALAEAALREEKIYQKKLRILEESMGARAVSITIRRSHGNAGDQILSAARELDADIIAMGMQGETHVPYGMIGATTHTVTTNGPCPVLTVPLPAKPASPCVGPPPSILQVQRILAPVDFSEPSLDSLECAIHVAHRLGADLVLLHVLEPVHADWDLHRMEGASQVRDQWEARLGSLAVVMKSLGLSATYESRTGFPPDSILAAALQHCCDLIVMGTHGRQGRERMNVGSVAEAVLKQATCPVLTVKQPKFATRARPVIETVLAPNGGNAATEHSGFDTKTH